jgi:DNA-binding response OmpR family regulator
MQGAETTGELILVVDDDHHNLFVVQRRLESYEYQVITASSGDTALELAEANKPELILLDVKMPGMDGFEVKKRLGRIEATRDIPVIFLSDRVQIEIKVEAFNLGADDFLAKPYHPEELLARIRVVLRHRQKIKQLEAEVRRLDQHLRGGGYEVADQEEALDKLDRAMQIADSRREAISCIYLKINGISRLPNPALKRVVLMETNDVLQEMINAQTDAVLAYREEGEYLLYAVGMNLKRAQILGEGVKSSIIVRAFSDPQSEQHLSVSIGISGKDYGMGITKEAILAGAADALQQAIAAGASRIVTKRLEEQ